MDFDTRISMTEIFLADVSQKLVLRHMLELYFYDLSEFCDDLELDSSGLYGYGWLDYYWTEKGRFPYLLRVDGRLAGFALVQETKPGHFYGCEFFIMRKYRRRGLANALCNRIFQAHKGDWTLNTDNKNTIAIEKWRGIVDKMTGGNFTEEIVYDGKRTQWRFNNGNF
ncbi:MAG: GNAT family N-acetyltransferase [Defluviitaleaceae bacterium]|nr:GNAT family N-acetyltransferase [Defluviitaleaceae bacterium]